MPVGKILMSADEAARAIYVDYEASKDAQPTLLGACIDKQLAQYVVEPLFFTCCQRWGVSKVCGSEHRDVVRELVRRSISENRVIVSWSEFDYQHLLAATPDLIDHVEANFRNAIFTARRWRRQTHPHVNGENKLLSYLQLTGYTVPPRFRGEVVGNALRLIRRQLIEGRTYETLTPAARRAWRGVVRHNQYDLWGMEHVVNVASARNSRSRRNHES